MSGILGKKGWEKGGGGSGETEGQVRCCISRHRGNKGLKLGVRGVWVSSILKKEIPLCYRNMQVNIYLEARDFDKNRTSKCNEKVDMEVPGRQGLDPQQTCVCNTGIKCIILPL